MRVPLRIALIAPNRFPIRPPFAGGLEAHVRHLARVLTKAGHRVSCSPKRVVRQPISDPPIEHLADIIANAVVFEQRWGWWPMQGRLDTFENVRAHHPRPGWAAQGPKLTT